MLSGKTIKERNLIYNGKEENFQPASYDLTLDYMEDLSTEDKVISIKPGDTVLATTVEYLALPKDVEGFIKDKSSYLRQGLRVGQGYVDPGFKGTLTIAVFNATKHTLFLNSGKPFCQIVFAPVEENDTEYDGHYQNQQGIGRSVNIE